MSAERDPLERLLSSVSDGRPVDWESALREAGQSQRARVEALRDVSRIGEFSRALQRDEPAGDGPPPAHWGDLLLLERVGTGAQADVYRAWDASLAREVALKLLRPDAVAATAAPGESPLLAEGRALARIRHPNVVAVHGIDRHDGRIGLRMEMVRGASLELEVQGRGPFTPDEAARLGVEIGSALAAVHAAGLLHRDVKPANVVCDASGRHVLADFGLGLHRDDRSTQATWPAGTPMSMAPEVLAGGPPSVRSDVYSLGLLLWFALAGRHPFAAGSLAELRQAAAAGPSPALPELRPDVPPPLAAIVEQACAPDPDARFASAQHVVEALERWRDETGAPGRARAARRARRRRARLTLALTAVAVSIAFIVLLRQAATGRAGAAGAAYAVEAALLRRDGAADVRLGSGDRVQPGDRLSLELHASRPVWAYVLNEDERGERYLLFPQPLFDTGNPLPAGGSHRLPGRVGGRENAWTVTSRGGRESFLVVVSPRPVPELEEELASLPAPDPAREVVYADVGEATVARLRGVGGLSPAPAPEPAPGAPTPAFDRFRALAGRETGVRGVWVRRIVLENPD